VPQFAVAQSNDKKQFEAKIIEIIDQKEIEDESGQIIIQQNILLKGLTEPWNGQEIHYNGISDIVVLNMTNSAYKVGDRVVMNSLVNQEGENEFFILDLVRRNYIYLLGFLFAIVVFAVGRKKGMLSLFSLLVSFFIIIKLIIPLIINGYNPLIVALFGSFLIMMCIMYLTEGVSKKTHVGFLSVFISLLLAFLLSIIFVNLTRLTGFSSEDVSLLANGGNSIINFKGLLLAGILIGTLGVLDDAILSQIEAVDQLITVNPNLSKKEVIYSAHQIGRTHIGAMVNTLFLAYAGASLPLLILFSLNTELITFGQAMDNEFIATEIIRTLTGSIGLCLAIPIATILATYVLHCSESTKNVSLD